MEAPETKPDLALENGISGASVTQSRAAAVEQPQPSPADLVNGECRENMEIMDLSSGGTYIRFEPTT